MKRRSGSFALVVLLVLLFAGAGPMPAAAAPTGIIKGKVTDLMGKYLNETVVHVVKAPGEFPQKAHVMKDLHHAFVPHVLAISFGDTVEYINREHVDHNVYSPDHETYNLGVWRYNQIRTYHFDKHVGAYRQKCWVHPSMKGWVYVNQNPYEAVVHDDGTYTIEGVPPGHYQLAVWNSHYVAKTVSIDVKAGKVTTADFNLERPHPAHKS